MTTESLGLKLCLPHHITNLADSIYSTYVLQLSKTAHRPSYIELESELAACLYLACRLDNNERTFMELANGTNYASNIEIARSYKKLCEVLNIQMGQLKF